MIFSDYKVDEKAEVKFNENDKESNIHLTQHFSKNEWNLYFNFIWYIRYQNKVFKPIQTFPCLSEDGYNKFSEVLLEDSNAKEYFVFLF